MLLGAATILLTNVPTEEPPLDDIWRILLLVAWVIDGGAFLYILGTLVQNFYWNSTSGRNLLKVEAFILGIVLSSLVLFVNGQTRLAVLIAGGPPVVLGVVCGFFFGLLFLASRNTRWN